ncbi:MAG TPA: PLP-dependent aminotransferase family protein [Pyrinomonadaceae bacterium]|nr:PLP-dependent aminotransferase family protein [Pyrinomonadaceae bacterium]
MSKHLTAAPFASVPLEESSSTPLYYQVYQRLRSAILFGQLSPGTRLPSTRQMANDLGVSRNTLLSAFDQLTAEGYVEGKVGAGTFVSPTLPEDLLEARLKPKPVQHIEMDHRPLSERGRVIARTAMTVSGPVGKARPFIPGTPALDQFPMSLWSRLLMRHWRDESRDLLNYGPAAGYGPLREAIAAYLGPSRGVQCNPDQIVIVSGTQQALDLAARVLIDSGDSVLVEEYCYSAAQAALVGAGATLVPVPVDDAGLDISAIATTHSSARVAYVTPSHQYPLGVTMSLSRRLALLDWANRASAWILEDDYDSEYRYVARPLAALQGLDKSGRVIYIGTFSKVLFPSLRIGYVVVPPDLVEAFVTARAAAGWCCPTIDQAVLADFIGEGHFTRHIRRMRSIHAERQATLLETLQREAGDLLGIARTDAGIHVRALLPDHLDDKEVAAEALAQGVVAYPLSAFYLGQPNQARSGLVLGYGAYNVRQIREAARKLAVAVKTVARANTRDGRPLRHSVI